MNFLKVWLGIIVVFICIKMEAQEFLQMEVINMDKKLAFGKGATLVYKSKEFPDDWQKKKINRFLPEENMIVFEDGLEPLSNIIKIREFKALPYAISRGFYVFSISSLIYGIIDKFRNKRKLGSEHLTFIVAPAVVGFIIDKLAIYHVYDIGKNARLTLMDMRMTDYK